MVLRAFPLIITYWACTFRPVKMLGTPPPGLGLIFSIVEKLPAVPVLLTWTVKAEAEAFSQPISMAVIVLTAPRLTVMEDGSAAVPWTVSQREPKLLSMANEAALRSVDGLDDVAVPASARVA